MKRVISILLIFFLTFLHADEHYILLDFGIDVDKEKLEKLGMIEEQSISTDIVNQEIIYQYYPWDRGLYGSISYGDIEIDPASSLNIVDKITYNYAKVGIGLSFIEGYYIQPLESDIPQQYTTQKIKPYKGAAIELLNFGYHNFFGAIVAGRQYADKLKYGTDKYHDISGDYVTFRVGYSFGDRKKDVYVSGAIPGALQLVFAYVLAEGGYGQHQSRYQY
jgi:hypothetical protein